MRTTENEKTALMEKARRLRISVADLLHQAAENAGLFIDRKEEKTA